MVVIQVPMLQLEEEGVVVLDRLVVKMELMGVQMMGVNLELEVVGGALVGEEEIPLQQQVDTQLTFITMEGMHFCKVLQVVRLVQQHSMVVLEGVGLHGMQEGLVVDILEGMDALVLQDMQVAVVVHMM